MTTAISPGASLEVSLPQGTVRCTNQGTGPTLVFVHGLLANHLLWSRVIPPLISHFRCIAPDLPLGAHSHPFPPDADISPLGVARLIADFLEALDLQEVTLISNDTGGAMCQLVDDPFFSQRLARRLQQAFPDARLHFLSHCRAFVPLDQPEAFAQHITEFVHAHV